MESKVNKQISVQTKLFPILVRVNLTLVLTVSFTLSAAVSDQSRSLSFAERVTYQRAIEKVYWQHRIWPRERPDPKPSLEAVMSQGELEKKVIEYVRNSQVLEEQWQRPITLDQLQAEMDRMAQHTRQPKVLRELFAALDNDPYVIAECLVRPALAERLLTNSYSHDQESLGSSTAREIQIAANYVLPSILSQPSDCDDSWTATSAINAASPRNRHTAVWTGTEMIVWGGFDGANYLNTGGRYIPSTDSWTLTSTLNAPAARQNFTAVWTGSEMIVWGGFGVSGSVNTGGRYNPSTDSWTATTTTNAPDSRSLQTSVWTGNEMIVWGGVSDRDHEFNTGGRYNPATDTWTAASTTGAPSARTGHTAIWTGSEMVIWGGYFFNGISYYFNTGGRYNPVTDTWTATTTTNAPTGRAGHTAVWTGSEIIVWAGGDINGEVDTGGRYNPSADSWTPTSTVNAPAARQNFTGVWTGSEMIVWGGFFFDSFGHYLNTGGRYNPATDTWTATTTANAPTGRERHTAVWTDSDMIVWGGWNGVGYFSTGGSYCGQGESITLDARVVRQGGIRIVVLTWTPADGGTVNVLRNGVVVATTDDDGAVKDKLGTHTGTFTYQVCETDSGDCSNEVTVRVRGAAD